MLTETPRSCHAPVIVPRMTVKFTRGQAMTLHHYPSDRDKQMLLIIKHRNFRIAHLNNVESVKYDKTMFLIFLVVILPKQILISL